MEFLDALKIALKMLLSLDPEILGVVSLSLMVSFTAVGSALLIGLPIGALLSSYRFPGRWAIITLSNTFLGMPPVVVGLFIYVLISRTGPFGWLGILYTSYAMMLAQFVLVLPISIALSRQIFESLNAEYTPLFGSLRTSKFNRIIVLITEARVALITIALACFGRAIPEVGAVMIVGGNIRHSTRVMTTAIGLETSRGELATAMALGIVLLGIALSVNIASQFVRSNFEKSTIND